MLKEKILKVLEKENQPKNPEEFRLNPSGLSKCRRAVWYEYHTKPSDPIPPHSLVKMKMGDAAHSAIQSMLKDLDGVEVVEIEKDKEIKLIELLIRYRIDAVVKIKGETYVVELKSTYSNGWDRVSIIADDGHVMQLKTYMALEEIKNGLLVYIARDNGLIAEHIIHMTDEEIKNHKEFLIKKGSELKQIISLDEPPTRDYNVVLKTKKDGTLSFEDSDWQCRYCQYRSLCVENKKTI